MSEFDINIIDENYYKFPVFPISENNTNTLSLFDRLFKIVTNINWDKIYDRSRIKGDLFVDSKLNKELLSFTNTQLSQLESIDKQVELILQSEQDHSEKRATELKIWLVKYFAHENKINFPRFNSILTLRLAYLILISILIKVFPEGIWCSSGEVSKVQNTSNLKLYLPSHKSHVDYMIIHIMCIRLLQPVPTVIAGENLNVFVFGNVLARVGAVYIKRNWFNYTDILVDNYSNFLKFILDKGIDMELFIEGGRSRDGKVLIPKIGILKLIHDLVKREKIPVTVAPLSIQYEKIYEFDSINNELIGVPKRKESMLNILRHGYNNAFHPKNHGKVYLRFGTDFDLLEYKQNVSELAIDVMTNINEVTYITDVALFNTAIYITYYQNKSNKVLINLSVEKARFLLGLIIPYTSQDSLILIAKLDDFQLTKRFLQTCRKFNHNCEVEREFIIVNKITDLILYKNNLIHLLINKSLIATVVLNGLNDFEFKLDKMKRLFEHEFISFHRFDFQRELNEWDLQLTERSISDKYDELQTLSEFLNPFIDSYIMFAKLLLRDKDAIMKNLKPLQPNYMESKNKSYLVNLLKLLNELKIYSQKETRIDEVKLTELIVFLQQFQRSRHKALL